MNPWLDLLVTIVVRLVCGFALGGLASFIVGFRAFMRAIATDGFPIERGLAWGAVGAVLCLLTTPRDRWPRTKA